MIPAWFLFAFAGSLCSAAGLYTHQRLKGESLATAMWVKVLGVCVAAPVLMNTGLPTQPIFYVFTAAAAAIWCISDMIYYQAVNKHGAALLTRLTPFGIIISFVAWFGVKPALFHAYVQDLPRFAMVAATLLFAAFCAFEAKKCPASSSALRSIWFVIVAAVVGTFLVKGAVDTAPKYAGVFGYVGIEAALMLVFYTLYFTARDKSAMKKVFCRRGLLTGGTAALFIVTGIVLRTAAQQRVDHPAYVSAIGMLEIVWLMIATRLSGWKDTSNKWAGIGIALSALTIAALKIK